MKFKFQEKDVVSNCTCMEILFGSCAQVRRQAFDSIIFNMFFFNFIFLYRTLLSV